MYNGRSQLQLANISSMSKSTLVSRRMSFREIDSLSGIAFFNSSPFKWRMALGSIIPERSTASLLMWIFIVSVGITWNSCFSANTQCFKIFFISYGSSPKLSRASSGCFWYNSSICFFNSGRTATYSFFPSWYWFCFQLIGSPGALYRGHCCW